MSLSVETERPTRQDLTVLRSQTAEEVGVAVMMGQHSGTIARVILQTFHRTDTAKRATCDPSPGSDVGNMKSRCQDGLELLLQGSKKFSNIEKREGQRMRHQS